MGLLGLSLLVASVVYVILRPPPWFSLWRGFAGAITDGSSSKRPDESRKPPETTTTSQDAAPRIQQGAVEDGRDATMSVTAAAATQAETCASTKQAGDRAAMPPPPPLPTIQPPTIEEPDSPTTPKASATPSTQPVPSFSLSDESSSPPSGAPGLMLPPPPPPPRPSSGRIPALNQFPAPNSAQRARGPAPNRGPPSSSSSLGLAPPPTHSSVPSKPSRKVMLTPGHSPLDWARISGPNADLRGLPPSSPFLRVTPSMLKVQTGRKGKDAWMALSGRVYNVTPYAEFHPGGVPELMRGAARDATKLFGEVHPWVNYETMLSACLVGLLVDEPEAGQENDMDKMD